MTTLVEHLEQLGALISKQLSSYQTICNKFLSEWITKQKEETLQPPDYAEFKKSMQQIGDPNCNLKAILQALPNKEERHNFLHGFVAPRRQILGVSVEEYYIAATDIEREFEEDEQEIISEPEETEEEEERRLAKYRLVVPKPNTSLPVIPVIPITDIFPQWRNK